MRSTSSSNLLALHPVMCEDLRAAVHSETAAAEDFKGPWLADVIAALLLRASELTDGDAPTEQPMWGAAFDALYPLTISHLQALKVRLILLPHEVAACKTVMGKCCARIAG